VSFELGGESVMKMFIPGLVLLSVLADGCAKPRPSDTASDSWLSGPQLESRLLPIAKDFAKQHGIAFDFTGTHCRIQIDTGGPSGRSPICGNIFFDHGIGKLGFEMMIDHTGKVIDAWTVVPEEGLRQQPGGHSFNRVGGGDFSPRLPHHRTCGSASGGSWQS